MGSKYGVCCTKCDYRATFTFGIGMMYSPHAVFYECRIYDNKPMLTSLVKSRAIKEKAFELLNNGATPTQYYGHQLYICPKCKNLHNRFFFCLELDGEKYMPDYKCSICKTLLKRVTLESNQAILQVEYLNHKSAEWKCPKCGNYKLTYDLEAEHIKWG